MDIITISGSLKFKNKMMEIAEDLALKGYCVLTPVYPTKNNSKRTEEEMTNLRLAHFKKIELSDMLYVLDVDNYIGDNTKEEIEYAKTLKKEIRYYSKEIIK